VQDQKIADLFVFQNALPIELRPLMLAGLSVSIGVESGTPL